MGTDCENKFGGNPRKHFDDSVCMKHARRLTRSMFLRRRGMKNLHILYIYICGLFSACPSSSLIGTA